jgi:cytochrome c oxidase subunit 2
VTSPVGVTDTRLEFRHLDRLYVPVALVVAGLVLAAVVFALVRYRARADREPSARTEAKVLESVYALVLAAVVAVLVVTTFRTESRVDALAGRPGLRVDVVASKWTWRFAYAGTGVSDTGSGLGPPVLHVPTGTTVRFRLTSLDVIHSFYMPGLRFKRDAFPRRYTSFDLDFDHAGLLNGECAEFCGLHHSDMAFVVDAMAPAQFRAWLADRRATTRSPGAGP